MMYILLLNRPIVMKYIDILFRSIFKKLYLFFKSLKNYTIEPASVNDGPQGSLFGSITN
jgi:hypothetical protein